jgi:hypothetical protein
MLSILAISIAGFSLTCIIITVYRNLSESPIIVLKSDHGPPTQEIAVADNEINLIL